MIRNRINESIIVATGGLGAPQAENSEIFGFILGVSCKCIIEKMQVVIVKMVKKMMMNCHV